MSYENKIQAAREAISSHNLMAGSEAQVNGEEFFTKLQSHGGTTEAALRRCSWEDLMRWGLPELLAKVVADIFRSREPLEEVANALCRAGDQISGVFTQENLLRIGLPNAIAGRLHGLIHGMPPKDQPDKDDPSSKQ